MTHQQIDTLSTLMRQLQTAAAAVVAANRDLVSKTLLCQVFTCDMTGDYEQLVDDDPFIPSTCASTVLQGYRYLKAQQELHKVAKMANAELAAALAALAMADEVDV